MSKKGFSATRLSIKIAILLFIPMILMTQINGPSGRPLISTQHLNPVTLISNVYISAKRQITSTYIAIKQFLKNETITGRERVFVYRWKDKFGNWQYSQRPPVNGITFEHVEVVDNSIRMPKPSDRLSTVLSANDERKNNNSSPTSASSFPLSASPSEVKNLLQDAGKIQQGTINRHEQLKNL